MAPRDDTAICVRRYGLLAPLDWDEAGEAQMRAMRRLWNRLVEIEQAHRQAVAALTGAEQEVQAAEERLARLADRRETLIAERKARRKAARSRAPTPDLDEQIAALKPLIAEAAAATKAARQAARARLRPRLARLEAERTARVKYADHYLADLAEPIPERLVALEADYQQQLAAALAEDAELAAARDALASLVAERRRTEDAAERAALDETIRSRRRVISLTKRQRKAALKQRLATLAAEIKAIPLPESPVFWANANAVRQDFERARDGALKRGGELRFRAWRGEGRLVNQIPGGGITVGEFLSAGHAQVRLGADPLGERTMSRHGRTIRSGGRHAGRRHALCVTVHSAGRGTRHMASLPILMHRPLPTDGTLKEVTVTRRKVASDDRWHAVFLTRVPARPPASRAGKPILAVNCGWRRLDEGLRVATVLASNRGLVEYVVLPEAILEGHERLREWQSERDKALIESVAWLRSLAPVMAKAPAELAEAYARFLRTPRPSPRSVARIALAWRAHQGWRSEDWRTIEDIRRADKRLWVQIEHARAKLIGRRRDLYRCVARRLAGMAGEIVVDAADWAALARRSSPDGTENPLWQGARRNRQIAAVGELITYIREAAGKLGVPVVAHDGPATWRCHRCGHEIEKRRPAELYQFCGHCDPDHVHPIDQDENAVRVMAAE